MKSRVDEQGMVLISIIYQLLDKDSDISNLNPYVQEYIQGLVDELNEFDTDEQDMVYFYADTFFNKINNFNETGVLH
jgi:hypothetical protein